MNVMLAKMIKMTQYTQIKSFLVKSACYLWRQAQGLGMVLGKQEKHQDKEIIQKRTLKWTHKKEKQRIEHL